VNDGQYFLGNFIDPTVENPPQVPYAIEYNSNTQFFSMALFQEPISESRRGAEQFLMRFLGLSETQLCQLNYRISVPNRVNQIFAGVSLGFSFCPGSVVLE